MSYQCGYPTFTLKFVNAKIKLSPKLHKNDTSNVMPHIY